MESSRIFGDHEAEEYQSGESGWTMYLGSSINDDDEEEDAHVDDHSHGMKKKKKKKAYVDDGYDGSDDSMASDASSGPSNLHQQPQPWEGDDRGHGHGHDGMTHKYHKEDKVKKLVKKKKNIKTGFEARDEQKDEWLVDEKRSIVTVQSGNKGRYKGQRK